MSGGPGIKSPTNSLLDMQAELQAPWVWGAKGASAFRASLQGAGFHTSEQLTSRELVKVVDGLVERGVPSNLRKILRRGMHAKSKPRWFDALPASLRRSSLLGVHVFLGVRE